MGFGVNLLQRGGRCIRWSTRLDIYVVKGSARSSNFKIIVRGLDKMTTSIEHRMSPPGLLSNSCCKTSAMIYQRSSRKGIQALLEAELELCCITSLTPLHGNRSAKTSDIIVDFPFYSLINQLISLATVSIYCKLSPRLG